MMVSLSKSSPFQKLSEPFWTCMFFYVINILYITWAIFLPIFKLKSINCAKYSIELFILNRLPIIYKLILYSFNTAISDTCGQKKFTFRNTLANFKLADHRSNTNRNSISSFYKHICCLPQIGVRSQQKPTASAYHLACNLRAKYVRC